MNKYTVRIREAADATRSIYVWADTPREALRRGIKRAVEMGFGVGDCQCEVYPDHDPWYATTERLIDVRVDDPARIASGHVSIDSVLPATV